MTMKRLALTIGLVGAVISGGVWGTAQVGNSASFSSRRVGFALKVATVPPTKAAIQGDGYIPAELKLSEKPSKDGSRNVFGQDERIPMTSSAYPWSAIGRVEAPIDQNTVSRCTGTLIARDLVVTNAHCVFGKDGKPYQSMSFAPNLIDDRSQDNANVNSVVVGTDKPEDESAKDWAILKLDQSLGEKYGWMEWVSADVSKLAELPKRFILAGYSGDFPKGRGGSTAGVHLGCSIRGFEPQLGLAMHDCDMTRGASGGAIFYISDKGMGRIVALNESERRNPAGEYPARFSRETANYAVLTQAWAGAAQELRAQSQR